MTLHTHKNLKSQHFREKKVYILFLTKDVDSKRKFEIIAKKFRLEKVLFFWVTLILTIEAKTLRHFIKYSSFYKMFNVHILTKY